MPVSELPNPWYYLDNFEFVLRWVARRYADLLNDEERHFIDTFLAQNQPSRGLLVRMIMRKGPFFRRSKLSYTEIGATADAAAALIHHGWVANQPEVVLADLFRLFTRNEINSLFDTTLAIRGLKSAAKPVQLACLQPAFPHGLTLDQWIAANGVNASSTTSAHFTTSASSNNSSPPGQQHALDHDRIYHVTITTLCDRLRLMFFGNLRQDWSEFVLADLGLYQYESVAFPDAARAFMTRDDVDSYLYLHQCRVALDEQQEDVAWTAKLANIPTASFASDWLESRRARLLFHAGQQAERRHLWQTALECYAASTDPGARTRQIRMFERLGQHEQAFRLANDALQQPSSEAESQAIERMLPRIAKHCGQTKPVSNTSSPARLVRLTLSSPNIAMQVEEEVRRHVHTPDAPAFYVENTLFNGLFGLLCWDAIFASIPGAFFHPFQHGPADLLRAGFRERRHALFQNCLAQLKHGGYHETIQRNFNAKQGLQSPFVTWGALTPSLVALALSCIPAKHLHAFFSRMLDDIRHNRSGLPDLIQFWPNESRYQLIEVKGPGDRLQDNQTRWLRYCEAHDIDTLVCHVQRPVSP